MHEVERGLELLEEYGLLSAAPDSELDGITKRCSECFGRKPILAFHRYPAGRSRDGFRPVCIECRREKERARIRESRRQQAIEKSEGIIRVAAAELLPGDVLVDLSFVSGAPIYETDTVESVLVGNVSVRITLGIDRMKLNKTDIVKVKRGAE